jgi:5'-nucleotidase
VNPIPRRSLRAVLIGAVAASLLLTPAAIQPAQAAPAPSTTIALLNFNDFHGRIEANNTVRFAGTIEKERATYGDANTLLLSAGDNIGASLFASATQSDQPTIDVLNALDLKASAVGNHEFDKGFSDLTDRVINGGANAKWDYLGANVYAKGTTTPVLPQYSIQTVGGIKVGVIGVVTQEAPSLVSPAGVANLDFGDEVAAVNRVAAQLKDGNDANGEAQVVVAEFHDGSVLSASGSVDLAAAKAASSDFADMVNNTSAKVDVIFNGHTHATYAWKDGNRPIVQAASYGTNLGEVVLKVDNSSGAVTDAQASVLTRSTADVATLVSTYPRVSAVNDITNAALAHAAVVGNEPVGAVTADVTTAFSGGSYVNGVWTGGTRDDRFKESSMGTLVANSLLSSMSAADRGGAAIGITNPGGLRGELLYAQSGTEGDGVVTYAEANTVLPFVNNLGTTTLTGAQLKQVLEEQWQPVGAARSFLALGLSSNVTYTYDAAAAAGSHITSVWVNGKLVSAADTIRVGTFSFLLAGGDNFTTFASGADTKDSGLVDYEAWIDYLKAHNPVTPSFAKHGAALTAASTAKVGEPYSLTASDLGLTSLGSPQNTSLEVRVGNSLVTTVPVSGGAATATFTMPSTGEVTLTALPSNTVVRVPVITTALATTTKVKVKSTKVAYGTGIVATATVTGTKTGTVRFSIAGLTKEATLVNGVATVTLPNTVAVGTHQVVASFVANPVAAASTSAPVTVKITKATVVVIDKAIVKTASVKKSFSYTVRTKALGTGVWATGTLKTYLHGHLIGTTKLTAADKGSQRITIAAKYLKWYGRGASLTVTTKLTDSATTKSATVKLVRLHLV